ncbi:hypothetical protein EDC01DRAFT_782608 [Geopyxis carbonaria]|nr:hypothetical protein EDC01DRAFT_782608 [Geopyxis carbonaria]
MNMVLPLLLEDDELPPPAVSAVPATTSDLDLDLHQILTLFVSKLHGILVDNGLHKKQRAVPDTACWPLEEYVACTRVLGNLARHQCLPVKLQNVDPILRRATVKIWRDRGECGRRLRNLLEVLLENEKEGDEARGTEHVVGEIWEVVQKFQ